MESEQSPDSAIGRPGAPTPSESVDTASQVDSADAAAQEEEVPLNAQVAAQQEQQRQLDEEITAEELDSAANHLRSNPSIGNQKVAGKLQQAAEDIRDEDEDE